MMMKQDAICSRVIALMNQKGGVGKTTTAVNLSAGLASVGVRTLVVDLDPQAHATLHLGIEPESLEKSVYEVMLDPPGGFGEADRDDHVGLDPEEVIVKRSDCLDVLPAVTDLAAIETELASERVRHHRLKATLREVGDQYDFIMIDCPPSLGLLTLNGLAAAREVLIPMQAHFLALQGVGKLLETVQMVGQQVNPALRVAGVTLCMHDEQARHTREVVADLEAFFEQAKGSGLAWDGARVFRPAVRRNIKLAECPSFGQTVYEYDKLCAGAKDYAELARVLIEVGENREAPIGTTGEVEGKPTETGIGAQQRADQ